MRWWLLLVLVLPLVVAYPRLMPMMTLPAKQHHIVCHQRALRRHIHKTTQEFMVEKDHEQILWYTTGILIGNGAGLQHHFDAMGLFSLFGH